VTEVDRLLRDYVEAHRAGGDASPGPWLDRVAGAERAKLAALIDAYLEQAPRRSFSRERFEASPAAALADSVARSLEGRAGLWPSLLPRLRDRARIRRSDLVAELAARLGAHAQRDKVAAYYHRMEQGTLDADGVSDTVLEALGRIVGQSAEALREAGRALPPGGARGAPAADVPAFARTTRPGARPEAGSQAPEPGAAEERDEVDRLFRGG
jgi:hypothetical protein